MKNGFFHFKEVYAEQEMSIPIDVLPLVGQYVTDPVTRTEFNRAVPFEAKVSNRLPESAYYFGYKTPKQRYTEAYDEFQYEVQKVSMNFSTFGGNYLFYGCLDSQIDDLLKTAKKYSILFREGTYKRTERKIRKEFLLWENTVKTEMDDLSKGLIPRSKRTYEELESCLRSMDYLWQNLEKLFVAN